MILHTTLDKNGSASQLINIRVDDVLFIEPYVLAKGLHVHTENQTLFMWGSLQFYLDTFRLNGYDFRLLDRSSVVNLSKIKLIEKEDKMVFFDLAKVKGCTLSYRGFKDLMNILGNEEERSSGIIII
jgi:DNA-binding LytR/AlgR family response regulator